MKQEDLVKRTMAFKRNATRLFNTPDGKKVIAYLVDSYVNNSALGEDVNQTMYKLGQKEFVQGLLRLIKEPDQIDDIIIKNNMTED